MTIEKRMELKPCPFCGENVPRVSSYGIDCIEHQDNFCVMSNRVIPIDRWNTRHADPQFFSEIKKRCKEECEKKRFKADPENEIELDIDDEIYNQAVDDCQQAIDQMEVE